jgi:preprotein translocase subunit SecG
MQATANFIAISLAVFVAIFFAILLPLVLSGKRWKAAEEKARARRLVDAKMNARLLRLNL